MAMGPRPSQRAGARRSPMAEINVTPLVDVMLVLLIIFMVTAPLLLSGVPVNLPDSKAKGIDADKKPIVVTIDNEGRIFLDETEIEPASLSVRFANIAAKAKGSEPPQIFLRADTALDYGQVMKVMGELNGAGLNKVALVSTGEGAQAKGGASSSAEPSAQ